MRNVLKVLSPRFGIKDNITARVARVMLVTFITTFLVARTYVTLAATDKIPTKYVWIAGVHVHHLNYGIAILTGVGIYLLLKRPMNGLKLYVPAAVFAIGLALTFDEFGMWLVLSQTYVNMLSYDAIVCVFSILLLLVSATTLDTFKIKHDLLVLLVFILLVIMIIMDISLVSYMHKNHDQVMAFLRKVSGI